MYECHVYGECERENAIALADEKLECRGKWYVRESYKQMVNENVAGNGMVRQD